MPTVVFGGQLVRQVTKSGGADPGRLVVDAATLAQALDAAFARAPATKGYVVDERGVVRRHVAVFVDGALVRDRAKLDVPIAPNAEVYVLQALSGG